MPTLLRGPGFNMGSGRGCPLVVHCWADLQSGHGLRWYGNIMRMQNVSEYMLVLALVTFRVSRTRREMYCGHPHLSVCLSAAVRPHCCTNPDVTCGVVGDAP